VEDLGARGEPAEQRVAGIGDLYRREADLPLARAHLYSERPRQQLRAEADPEHGHLPRDRLAQPLALSRERRKALDFVDVHRPAHDDRAGDLLVRRKEMAGQGFNRLHVQLAAAVEDPVRSLPRHVLDRQQGRTLVQGHPTPG